MARTPLLWLAGAVIIASACSSPERTSVAEDFSTFAPRPTTTASAGTATTVPVKVTTTAPPATTVAPATTVPQPPVVHLPGRLAIVDRDGNVAVMRPDGSEPVVLTDAVAEGAAYFQPLWAPGSGALAWSEASPAGFGLVTISDDGNGRAVAGTPAPPFYFYWSPDGSRVAALHNGLNGVEMKLIDVGGTVATFVGSGVPFYYSWNPTGDGLAAHIGADRLAAIDEQGTTTELAQTDPGYQSPQWLALGILHLADGDLEVIRRDGSTADVARLTGNASFIANPQGTLLAVQSFSADDPSLTVALQTVPEVRPNIVAVIDLESGNTATASAERALGFFWSPDGEKLLMLHPTDEPGQIDVSVWEDGASRHLTRFTPRTSFVRDVLPFFPQYAQSYQLWSPDSSAYAFSGERDGSEGIWVHGIDGDGEPALIAGGSWVAWSDAGSGS